MNIELRSLRHVVVLARVLSYTRAAEQLGLTQSALSRSIQAFEQRLDTKLFDRDRSGVHLTPIGRAFVDRAAQVLQETQDLEQMLKLTGNAEAGEVAFGMAPLPAKALLAPSLLDLMASSPALRSVVAVRRAESLLPMLIAEEIEFFVCAEGQVPEAAPTRSVPLGWFTSSLIVRAGHPILVGGKALEQSYPLLLADRLKKEADMAMARTPYLSGPQHLIEDYQAAARITGQSDAIWLSSPFAAEEEIRQGKLVEAPFGLGTKAGRFRMVMYSLNRRSLSPAALKLKKLFQDQIRAAVS